MFRNQKLKNKKKIQDFRIEGSRLREYLPELSGQIFNSVIAIYPIHNFKFVKITGTKVFCI
jgi:hypothetical protein